MRKLLATTSQIFLLALLILTFATSALAQNNKGAIVGTVKDPNDALVSKAQVKVTSVKTGEVREAETSDDGTFTVTNLEPGVYNVTVEGSGFQAVTVEAVQVETNARLPLDVKFGSIAASSASVTVTADSAPLVESETSVRGDLITGRQVTDLPIPQRNFTLLAGLSPGVTRPNLGLLGGGGNFVDGGGGQNNTESTRFRESGGSVLVINGARATNNNFTLDGVDNNESQFGQIAIYPQPDAIAEFKIESSVPSAESGRAGGGIISTTFKSGGNEVHGTLGEIYQGRFLSAAAGKFDDPNSLPVPNYVTHNFYGTVGGPIFLPRPAREDRLCTTAAIVRFSFSRSTVNETVRRSSAAPAIHRRCQYQPPGCDSAILVSCYDREFRRNTRLLEAQRLRLRRERYSLLTARPFPETICETARAVAHFRPLL